MPKQAVKPLQEAGGGSLKRKPVAESPANSSRTGGIESNRKSKESDRKGKPKSKKLKSKKKQESGIPGTIEEVVEAPEPHQTVDESHRPWTVPRAMQRPHWLVPSGSLFVTHAVWETGDVRKHYHPPSPGAIHASMSSVPFMSYAGVKLDVHARPPPSRTPTKVALLPEETGEASVHAADKAPTEGVSAASTAATSVQAAPEEVAPKPPRLGRVPTKPELRLAPADDDAHAEEKGAPPPSIDATATKPAVERNFAPSIYPSTPAPAPSTPSLAAAAAPSPAAAAAASPEKVAPESAAAESAAAQPPAVELGAVEPRIEAPADGSGGRAGRRSSLTAGVNFLAGQAAKLVRPFVGSTSQPADSTDAPKESRTEC